MRTKLRNRLLAFASSMLGVLAPPAHAWAVDFEVQSDTAAQGYEVANPWGDYSLERRRVTQALGLAAYHLQGDYVPGEADYNIRIMMRLDADFGVNSHLEGQEAGGETSFNSASGARYIPGLEPAPIDLMYAWIEGRDLAGGYLGFKLGRQYVTDVLGWWSFDGGLVRFTTPYFVEVEAYGGFEQRGGLPLSTSRFESQGVWRGSHRDFADGSGSPTVSDYPSYQYAQVAPAFGFALQSAGPNWIHGRFSYRRVYNTGTSITGQFAHPSGGYQTAEGLRTSSDRLGYAANFPLLVIPDSMEFGTWKGGFAYDLYNQLMSKVFGGVEGYLTDAVTVGADVDYYEPTFDADSIFNWFTKYPSTTATLRTAIRFTKRFDVSASGGVKLWSTEGDPDLFGVGECLAAGLPENCTETGAYLDPTYIPLPDYVRTEENRGTSTILDGLGNLDGRYRFSSAIVGASGMVQTGERGRRVGGSLNGEKYLDGGRFSVGSRVSLYNWKDPLREDRDATSFGYVLGGGFRPAQFAKMNLEWEHNMNRLVGQRFRVLAMLNLRLP